jgi:DNA-binding NtrC family response regulator
MATILVVDYDKGMRNFLDIMLTRKVKMSLRQNAGEGLNRCGSSTST